MDHLQRYIRNSRAYAYLLLVAANLIFIGLGWLLLIILEIDPLLAVLGLIVAAVIIPFLIIGVISSFYFEPLKSLWQAILYMSEEQTSVQPPNLSKVRYGRELINNLVRHVYKLADVGRNTASFYDATSADNANTIIDSLPLPLLILDKDETILYANSAMLHYISAERDELQKKNLNEALELSFPGEKTFDVWLADSKENNVPATEVWERVKLGRPHNKSLDRRFDLVGYYNGEENAGYETMLVVFDRSKEYAKEDKAIDFVALVVHELRTPLTMLRGYVEALDEDLDGKVDDEVKGYLQKTQVAAGELTTFVNNILSVTRIDDNQITLKLREEQWQTVLPAIVSELALRAEVHGINVHVDVAPDLPAVGLDRVSMYEVISNLIDNAIKYSGKGKEIIISAHLSKDGLVETTVQDFGVGIPGSAIPKLFTKYYRDHHKRAYVAGTGLGLYLCNTFISAQGGNIWIKSKEDEGTTVGFTLIPYSQLAEAKKSDDNKVIITSAHGWIKNHSLYRR